LLLSALSAIGWILVGWKPMLGRWFTILALAAAVHLGGFWLHIPGSLAWAVIPTALAVPLVGFPAAVVTAVGESVVILGLTRYPAAGFGSSNAVAALVAVWGVFGGICAMHHQIHQQSSWLAEYFEYAQQSLRDAQDRRVELGQALDDLVHANRQLTLVNQRVAALRLIAEEALQVVHRNCQHISDMVNDVLDLTRIETDRMVLYRERVNIREVVDSAMDAVNMPSTPAL
jgi:signal transduction histidine kinase